VAVDGVVVNSFDELEHGSCELLAAATGKTVVAVGPVSLCRSPSIDSQSRQVMEWLDTKESKSVVYVSFGNAGFMPPAQVMQLGRALASCPWLSLGILSAIRYPSPKNLHLNPQYPKSSSDSECYYPNLFWVIRVAASGSGTTRTSVAWVLARLHSRLGVWSPVQQASSKFPCSQLIQHSMDNERTDS
jgi:hypothetical protein